VSVPARNIAYIIPGGVGTGKNNIGVPILERIIGLVAGEFNVTVFQLYPVNENYQLNNFRLISVYSKNRLLRNLKLLVIFRRSHRQERFDVVHAFWTLPSGLLAVMLGKYFSIKTLISLQGGDAVSLPELSYGQLTGWLPRRLAFWAMRRADVIISPSNYLIDNLRKLGFRRADIKLIPLGVDVSVFAFHEKTIGLPVQFIAVGNLTPLKDPVTLLKAFNKIAGQISCHLTIVGEGVLEEKIKAMALELNVSDKITFLGLLPYEAVLGCYHKADILLHTSLSEGHPIVAEEAMSCGVLVCGTRVGLLHDLDQCCVSVPTGDYEALASETLNVISNPERLRELRRRARHWSEQHSIKWTIDQFTNVYKSLL
jgi:glycosyltransferase involved in cell wall biosynthesis